MGNYRGEVSGEALNPAQLVREGRKLPGRDNWVIDQGGLLGEEKGPRPLPSRSSHLCGLRALDKEIGAKDLEDVGFPWIDDNRFCCYWVQLGPRRQGRNDACFYPGKVPVTHP